MSIARHHAEWLSLVEVVGPFLTMEVLLQVFPQGLAAHDSTHFALLRQAYGEWLLQQDDRQIHRTWVEWVLENTLAFPPEYLRGGQALPSHLRVELKEHQEILVPDWAIADPDRPAPVLLVQMYEPGQKLEGAMRRSPWPASPLVRMMTLLQGCGCPLGLVTNGEHWLLVHAPAGGAVTSIAWYSNLWLEEKITLRAFRDLVGVQRFFGVADSDTLPALFDRSKGQQQEITDQLGLQVRRAVEILIQKLDRINNDLGGLLLAQVTTEELYQAACVVMMRLVFLLCAEERDLLLLGDARYEENYAVSTLQESLREIADRHGEEILERRYDAWCRLLALFRAVHGGVFHDLFHLPAYGGNLFDPDRFLFLEGRFTPQDQPQPIQVDNRTVLHLLEALQILQIKVPGGGVEPRRLSFKAIEVEQIGHVYEGLLDHRAARAASTMLGLVGTKNKEPEVSLEELERLRAVGEDALLKFLKKETGRSESALRKLLLSTSGKGFGGEGLSDFELSRCLACCGNDRTLWDRILPFFPLVRRDSYDYPVIIPAGSVFVTAGTDRRESGTHYTPSQLTREIVKHTLDPLVYEGMAAGKPEGEWSLLSPQAILNLKICDPTMGSGAFLVQACRYLADRLVESIAILEEQNPEAIYTIFGEESRPALAEVLPENERDLRCLMAKRLIAERCLYGVDKNPLAVEMAKLSLWLETLQKDKPFTFVDHALRWGDSLVGATVAQLKVWSLDLSGSSYQLNIGANEVQRLIQEAIAKRRALEGFTVNSPADQRRKGLLLTEAEARLKDLRDRADLLVASYLAAGKKSEREDLRSYLLLVANGKASITEKQRQDLPDLEALKPFHWDLEFPEVFLSEKAGFDAIVGNPPFFPGAWLDGLIGHEYRSYIVQYIANNKKGLRGTADLCAYFLLRAHSITHKNSYLGYIVTSSVSEGDSQIVGLKEIEKSSKIYRGITNFKWPGQASVMVSSIWITRNKSDQQLSFLNHQKVNSISSSLTVENIELPSNKFVKNKNLICKGHELQGDGFKITKDQARQFISKGSKYKDVIFPLFIGDELNTLCDIEPEFYCINFKDFDIEKCYVDYPLVFEVIEKKVKPDRMKYTGESQRNRFLREKWWLFRGFRKEIDLYSKEKRFFFARTVVSKYNIIVRLPSETLVTPSVYCFLFSEYFLFSVIQSSIYEDWILLGTSSLGETPRFSAARCFYNFPLPERGEREEKELEEIGQRYYEHRQGIMQSHQEGLTKTYNRFHNPDDTTPAIQQLRDLHVAMDRAVAAAYGWGDLFAPLDKGGWGDLHGFHETKQGMRFTISEAARREILDRLLELNHQRHAEELKQGLPPKGKKSKTKQPKEAAIVPGQIPLDL